jgi:protein SCO1/2
MRLALSLLLALCLGPAAWAQRGPAPAATAADQVIRDVGLDQKLNAPLPLDLVFRDDSGERVPLRRFFTGKPVMLILIQYRCTMLCSEEMNVLTDSLRQLAFTPGREFTLLTVSIDHREQPDFAAEFKQGYLEKYGRPQAAAGWHFLTGEEAAIRQLAAAIGYRFTYDPHTDQFAHPDGVIVLTPEGHTAQYFFRLEYPPRDLRLALVEASRGKIGTPLDALALLCYHYDPVSGKYNVAMLKVLRLAALLTTVLLLGGVALMTLRERRGRRRGEIAAAK